MGFVAPTTSKTTLLDVIPILLGHWAHTKICVHIPAIGDIASLSMVCKSIDSEIGECPRLKLLHASICCQVPLLVRTAGIAKDACWIELLINSHIRIPRYLNALSALEKSAQENALAIVANLCSHPQPVQNICSKLRDALSPGSILRNVTYNDDGHQNVAKYRIMNTMICLSILMGTSNEMYDALVSGEWSIINMQNLIDICKSHNVDATHCDRSYNRHVDFRLHTTYLFFHFIGNVLSSQVQLGLDLTRTLQGQLLEAWRTKWNENNKRMYGKTMYLLDRVYDKLAREYGPPPSIVIAHMMAHHNM